MRILSSPTALCALVALLVPAASSARDCSCTDLSALQAELRNALRLQSAFRNQVTPLRSQPQGASQDALRRFAASGARQGLEPTPGSGPSEVDYVPYGESVALENLDRPSQPGQTPQQRQDQLCAMRDSSAAALDAAVRGAACDGIGTALRAHERTHVQMCRSIGYRNYLGMHGADRAAEEAEAYGAQIAVLRAEIFRVLERASPRLEVTSNARVAMQNNPVWRAILTDTQADVVTTRVSAVPSAAGFVRFEGQGQQTSSVRVEGNCRFTAGSSMTLPVTASIETDGLEARIGYEIAGTSPTIGIQCQVPGGGRGMAMSMPVPVSGALPPGINLPLRDQVDQTVDMAGVPAAAMMAPSGVQLTGQSRMRLALNCPAP